MTGSLQALMASNTPGAISGTATLSDVRGGANAIAMIALFSNGGVGSGGNGSTVPPYWYLPAPAPTMYATCTVNSGSAADAASSGALAPTSGSPQWGWTQSAVGTKTASCTLRIYSDAAGANLAATITFSVTAQRTS